MTQPTRNIARMESRTALQLHIEPQGAYLAYKCPEAVQLDVLSPVQPLPVSDFYAKLGEEGTTYEDEVFELLESEVAGAERISRNLDAELREEITLECMRGGVPLIIGGRLPTDPAGHRVGEPDLLVRASEQPGPSGRWGYRPVDVKNHLVRSRTGETAEDLATVLLLAPGECDEDSEDSPVRCNSRDAYQLAHYQRMLEACGHAPSAGRLGGIIGKELRLVWYDLDAPSGDPVALHDGEVYQPSLIEVYDFQFARRLVVLDRAISHMQDPGVALLAAPIAIKDCDTCCWQEFCTIELEEKADLSLLKGITPDKRQMHHERGVTDLHGLARLDHTTAQLMKEVDLADLRVKAADFDLSTPIAEIIPRRKTQIPKLAKLGVLTAGDLSCLDQGTLRYEDSGMKDLVDQIDLARARVGAGAVYRKRGVETLDVPRGDVEIDVDMESTNDGAYLWGALVAERPEGGPGYAELSSAQYMAFVSWDRPTEIAQVQAFKEFWDWLCGQREECAKSGRTLRAYCYSKGAENYQMNRIAPLLGIEAEVKEFIESEQWVDLHEVLRKQLITGHSMGLKEVAPLAGFSWRCDDSGGTQAIVRYDEASAPYDSEDRDEARSWLLDYNEDDVRATAALREWLDGDARVLPSVKDLSF